jgi:hypothetical protein
MNSSYHVRGSTGQFVNLLVESLDFPKSLIQSLLSGIKVDLGFALRLGRPSQQCLDFNSFALEGFVIIE